MNIEELIVKIKKKGVLKAIPDQFVRKEIGEHLRKNPNATEKEVFKAVRKYLHETYGAFQTNRKKKRYLYLEELKIAKAENGNNTQNSEEMNEIIRKILSTNVSAKERLEADYGYAYEEIKKNLRHPRASIMDLGCGMNPVAYSPADFKDTKVYAYDIDENDIDFLNKYFKIMNMNGEARVFDLHDLERVKKLPNVDICILFKIIDPLERRGHEFSEALIKILKEKARDIVVSFATKTVSKKPMNHPQRGWFEQMTKRLGFTFKTITTKNEIYYVLYS